MSALATTNGQTPSPIARVTEDMPIQTMAKLFADSGFFKDSRQAAQAAVKILAGRELGIPPVAAMTGIYIVKEKVMVGATVLASAVQRSGRFDYRIVRLDNEGCKLEFFERGKSVGFSEFTVREATAAGLMGNANYRAHPRNMFFSRAMSNGVKWYCPGVLGGPVYTPEELGVSVNAVGDPVAVDTPDAPATAPARRRSAADIIDETPSKAPAPPADVTGSERPETPGGGVEDPICGYADVGDWYAALKELAASKGLDAKKVEEAIKGRGFTSYLAVTEDKRRELWASLWSK